MTDSKTHFREGLALHMAGRLEAALDHYGAALAAAPGDAEILYNRGLALWALGRHAEGLADTEAALKAQPRYFGALYNRATMLQSLDRLTEALAAFDAALLVDPRSAQAHAGRGNALRALNNDAEALVALDRALALRPDMDAARNNRGGLLLRHKRYAEALRDFDALLARNPDHRNAMLNRTVALQGLERDEEVIAACEKLLALEPDNIDAFNRYFSILYTTCDWDRMAALCPQVRQGIEAGRPIVQPFELLGVFDDPALQRLCAANKARELPAVPAMWTGETYAHDRIRVAYLSADFNDHATALLAARLFELHDRSRFEVFAIDFTVNQTGAMHKRLRAAFEHTYDVRSWSDEKVARLIRELEVDIAVDLKGYTTDSRPAILSHRPAPLQLAYLGYPGSMGAPFIDYVIADPVVAPFDQQRFYDEKIVQLPHSYQPNDDHRLVAAVPSRAAAGLPPEGFVFVCFNSHWKITRETFAVWMRLLASVPGSVLWLIEGRERGRRNLRAAARAAGIDPARLIFAPRMAPDDHLARLTLADLMLDNVPCNGHTTCSDALWAGVPVVSCTGVSFASRVGASLLKAVRLPELITDNLHDYEKLALSLAQDAGLLEAVRKRLAANRLTQPLFDSARFTRDLEKAYVTMANRAAQGLAPEPFAVPQ